MAPFRYRKPGYVALNVTDVERSVRFYRDLVGLQLEAQDGTDAAYLRCSDDHHNLVLYRSEAPGLKRIAFELESASDLERAAHHIASLGWPLREVPDAECERLRQGRTLRFRIPASQLVFEFYARMGRASGAYAPSVAKIQRLGHVVVRCADRDAVLQTLTGELNFRVSDHFADQVAFLRCFPNPYHHSFGVARSDVDGLHHVNFMVTDVDDVGRATNRMRQAGVEVVYGPGRHDISNSIFFYYLDPDGLTVEYSFGMEEFPEQAPREARELPLKPEILDSWGGMPAPKFGKGGAVEGLPL
jgi:2,3-dihydroxy-p-cumate/2,3-dihydroxybenzoate 3,4-dioxygenase